MNRLRLLILVLLAAPAGCGKPTPSEQWVRPDHVTDFGKLYGQHCSGCHGADGTWGPAPPLNDPLFLAIISEGELERIIGEGRSKTLMPAFGKEHGGPLTKEQRQALVKGFRAQWQTPGKEYDPPPPAYLAPHPGDAAAGKKAYVLACAGCHGDDGKGGMTAGRLNEPDFLALISDQALRRIVITGRSDLGMPDYRGADGRSPKFKPLTPQDVADLVALLASWRPSAPAVPLAANPLLPEFPRP